MNMMFRQPSGKQINQNSKKRDWNRTDSKWKNKRTRNSWPRKNSCSNLIQIQQNIINYKNSYNSNIDQTLTNSTMIMKKSCKEYSMKKKNYKINIKNNK